MWLGSGVCASLSDPHDLTEAAEVSYAGRPLSSTASSSCSGWPI